MNHNFELNLIRNEDTIENIKSFTGVTKLVKLIGNMDVPVYDLKQKKVIKELQILIEWQRYEID